MAAPKEFVRLPGRGGAVYRQSLWLTADHLLCVLNRGYSEDYKRFYYRDIRAVQVRKTGTYAVINAILGVFAAICITVQALAFYLWQWNEGGQIAFGFLTAVFTFFVLINLLLGPTCAVQLYTAVHTEPLPALGRLRTANRALRLLRERVEAVQGTLTPEQVLQNAGVLEARPDAEKPQESAPATIEEYSGNFHWSLFSLLVFNALMITVGCFRRTAPLQVLNTLVYTGLGVCMIGALIRQRHSRIGKGLRRLAWTSVIYVWFVSVITSMIGVILMFEGKFQPGHFTYTDMIRQMLNVVPAEHPALLVLYLFSAACSLALGLAGLVLMLQYRRRSR